MTTERRAAAKLAAPTINLASLVYGLDAYMLSRGADAGEALRRAGLEPGDLTDPDRRVPLIRCGALGDLRRSPGRSAIRLEVRRPVEPRHAVVGNVALASRTVGEAFETIGRYLPTMVDATVHGVEVSDGIVFVYSYYIDLADDVVSAEGRLGDRLRVQSRAPRARRSALGPTGGPATAVGGRTPANAATRAEIMGDNIRVGHPWPASGLTPACSSGRWQRPMP